MSGARYALLASAYPFVFHTARKSVSSLCTREYAAVRSASVPVAVALGVADGVTGASVREVAEFGVADGVTRGA
jgi:hypothetical protein